MCLFWRGVALAEWFVTFLHHATLGLLQAHHPSTTFRHLFRDPIARKCVQQCFFLNVVLFRGALYVYERLVPRLCFSLLGISLDDWRYELAIVVLWSAPAYLICEIITTSLQFKMAQKMIIAADRAAAGDEHVSGVAGAKGEASGCGGADPGGAEGSSFDRDAMISFTSIVYTQLVYIAFMLQIPLICGVPLVGPLLTLVLSALLHAYNAFEFLWGQQGYGVAERFALIEHHWLYFLGYGGLLALLSLRLRFWDLFALRAALYPIYIANAPYARFEARTCQPLPVFQPPLVAFNAVIQLVALQLDKQ